MPAFFAGEIRSCTCCALTPWESYASAGHRRQRWAYATAVRNLRRKNVTIIRSGAWMLSATLRTPGLDFVYIDGDHSFDAVVRDVILWSNKVRPGGIVAAHDYCPWVA